MTTRQSMLASLLALSALCIPVLPSTKANDYGNLEHQEYGDAVYWYLSWANFVFIPNYNHAGLYAGIDSNGSMRVFECAKVGSTPHGPVDNPFETGPDYYGAFTLANVSLDFAARRNIMQVARACVDADLGYPFLAHDALTYWGFTFDGSIGDIHELRCDGYVEYCFESQGHVLWWNVDAPSDWNIGTDAGVERHNDMPGWPPNPANELSPWAQRGSPSGTGPDGTTAHADNSNLTRDATIDLPTYEVTAECGSSFTTVRVTARDAKSGIYRIGYRRPGEVNWTFAINPPHPTEHSLFVEFDVVASGWCEYFATDHGGNEPATPQAVYVEVGGPPAPANLRASDDRCNEIRVTWDEVPAATSYTVYRNGTPIAEGVSGTTYDDSMAIRCQSNAYTVAAVNECGTSAPSNPDDGVRPSPPEIFPLNLQASVTCGRIGLTWNIVPCADRYEILRNGSQIATVPGSSYEVLTATAGAACFTVRACSACGCVTSNLACVDPLVPPTGTPLDVEATDDLCDKVHITWAGVSGATSYKIYRNGSQIGTPTGTSYDDTSATPGTTYAYTVRASNNCGDGPLSSPDNGTRLGPPAAPSGVQATDACGTIQVTWDPVNGASQYEVFRNGTSVGTISNPPFTDNPPSGSGDLCYTVRAINSCSPSSPISPPACAIPSGAPTSPTNVQATDDRCDLVCVTWDPVAGAASYRILRNGSQIATATGTSYDDMSATPGTAFTYTVIASNNCGDSPPSASDSGMRRGFPAAPVNVQASDDACDVVRVTWSPVPGATSYEVFRNGSQIASGVTATTYTDETAAAGVSYSYTVNAENDCGESPAGGPDQGRASDCGPCGNGSCDGDETPCDCPQDCGTPPTTETDCGDGIDNDCDGLIDCDDPDCDGVPPCLEPPGPGDGQGACCLTNNQCLGTQTRDQCLQQGGTYLGDNSTCPASCESGACCLPSGTCETLSPTECSMQGGTFKGGDCAPSTCINEPPTAAIVASSTSGVAPLSVTFNAAQSTDPEGDALTYSWDFGDGSADRSGMIIEHEYDEPGTYIAVLTVTDSENLNDTASAQITVHQGITGACCLGDGSCREYTRRECEQRGGDFMGEAVPCNTGDGTCCGAGGVCGVALTLGGLISKRRRIAKWKAEQARRQNPA